MHGQSNSTGKWVSDLYSKLNTAPLTWFYYLCSISCDHRCPPCQRRGWRWSPSAALRGQGWSWWWRGSSGRGCRRGGCWRAPPAHRGGGCWRAPVACRLEVRHKGSPARAHRQGGRQRIPPTLARRRQMAHRCFLSHHFFFIKKMPPWIVVCLQRENVS